MGFPRQSALERARNADALWGLQRFPAPPDPHPCHPRLEPVVDGGRDRALRRQDVGPVGVGCRLPWWLGEPARATCNSPATQNSLSPEDMLMLIKAFLAAVLLGASSLFVAQDAEEPIRNGEYLVEGGHSTALYRVTHLGVSAFWGRFNHVEGKVIYDADDMSKTKVSITIPVESMDSNSDQRDGHLLSPDFFNGKEFPELTFRSTSVKEGDNGALEMTGKFTMLGETHEVTMTAERIGYGDRGRMGYRAGWEADFTILRSDYGMDFMTDMLGDDVRIIVALETILQ
ncbi:MAG: polyisoprenoid-binding protein YceI [Pseudohongiellaceae bacterium]|jgi:polyisoprenoid-binding protein YceI